LHSADPPSQRSRITYIPQGMTTHDGSYHADPFRCRPVLGHRPREPRPLQRALRRGSPRCTRTCESWPSRYARRQWGAKPHRLLSPIGSYCCGSDQWPTSITSRIDGGYQVDHHADQRGLGWRKQLLAGPEAVGRDGEGAIETIKSHCPYIFRQAFGEC